MLGLFLRVTAVTDAVPAFGLDQLRAAIQNSGATTISEIVPILRRNLGSNFTLIHHSESVQTATVLKPRVVFWDEQAGFAVSFNSDDSTERENNSLEMWQFDFSRSRFNFLRQQFPLAKSELGQVQFKPRAEESCHECHGADPRPIWAEYPKWPGVIGADDDLVKGKDRKIYDSFRQLAPTNSRYLPLFAEPTTASPSYPFRDDDKKTKEIAISATLRPNLRLNLLIARLNARRTVRMMRENPDYRQNIPTLLYGFLGCDGNGIQRTPLELTELAGINILDLDPRLPYTSRRKAELAQGSSYFDGSASMNELLANQIFLDAVRLDPSYGEFYAPRTLRQKYFRGPLANELDLDIHDKFDQLGLWIPTPFAAQDVKKKHREPIQYHLWENWKTSCAFLKGRTTAEKRAAIQPKALPFATSGISISKVQRFLNPNAFHLYRAYCAECHAHDGRPGNFHIENLDDIRSYLSKNGRTLIDKVALDKMPRGRADWSDRERADWERDRPRMLRELETTWRRLLSSQRAFLDSGSSQVKNTD